MDARILSVGPCDPSEIVRFEGMEYNHYTRDGNGNWLCCMNGSWEEMGEFEEGERLYQEHLTRAGEGGTMDDGGAAFPMTPGVAQVNGMPQCPGMSLRDWFAGMALNGCEVWDPKIGVDGVARFCYEMADAMIAERSKEKP